MSIKYEITSLYKTQNFVQQLYKSIAAYNGRYGTKFAMEDFAGRRIAESWRNILTAEYDFQDGDFAVLVVEVFGELLHEMITAELIPFTVNKAPAPKSDVIRISIHFILDLLEKTVRVKFVRSQDSIDAFVIVLGSESSQAHSFAKRLNLPPL